MTKRSLPILLAVLILTAFLPLTARAVEGTGTQYTVTMTSDIEEKLTPGEKSIAVGEEFSVKAMISGGEGDVYNAYDLKFTYDTGNLTFLGGEAADEWAEITDKNGHIRVKGYGDDKSVSVPAVILTFETKKKGAADVYMSTAYIDTSDNAGVWNVVESDIEEDTAEAQIQGYKVVAEDDSVQADVKVADDGDDVTFELKEQDQYDYTVTVTIGGVDVSDKVTYDEETGTYTIPESVIEEFGGKIVISTEQTCKTYKVTVKGEGVTGEETATYNTDYTFELKREKGYLYTVAVTIGGESYTEFDVEEDVYTIPGPAITGDIVITVTKEEDDSNKVKVTFAGAGAKDGSGKKKTERNVEYPFTVKQKKGYTYSVTVYVDGKRTSYDYDYELDTYYILSENVTGNIVIVIGKVPTIEITEYIALEKQNIYLVVFNGHVSEGCVPKYEGRSMYWSERYKAYVWLVTSKETVKRVKAGSEEKITLQPGTPAAEIDYSGNVDMDIRTDEKDARLVREMYEGKQPLEFMQMQKLLNADVYADKKLNIRDVVAIVKQYS